MMAILLIVMDVIKIERQNSHGSDMVEMEHKKIHEHIEIRLLAGILTMIQPDGTLSTILNCGIQTI